jgi:hypothetical protein
MFEVFRLTEFTPSSVDIATTPSSINIVSSCSLRQRRFRLRITSSRDKHKQAVFLDKLFQAFYRRDGKSLARKVHAVADHKLSRG